MPDIRRLENPYKGLKSFKEKDARFFFGREEPIQQLTEKIIAHKFIAILGSSGIGKTSLVRAGLIPNIINRKTTEGGSWHKLVATIGQDPMYNLAEGLAQLPMLRESEQQIDSERWINVIKVKLKRSENSLSTILSSPSSNAKDRFLIVIDQFEEIFKLQEKSTEHYEQAVEFFKLLAFAVQDKSCPIHVAVVMRSDFIAQSHQLPHLVELINQSQYVVPKMNRKELKRAITAPASVVGLSITNSLSARVVNDIRANANQLPILQHALMRMWSFHTTKSDFSPTLDLSDYEAVGGVERVLELHLEEVYHQLETEEKKRIAEKVFKAITEKKEGQSSTRKPTSFLVLKNLTEVGDADLKQVIEAFGKDGRAFITTNTEQVGDNTYVDLTHESIMLLWSRLGRWIEEEKESVKTYLELCQDAEMYHDGKVELLKNPQLDTCLYWLEQNEPTEVWGSQYDPSFVRAISFLNHSKQEHNFNIAYKEKQQKKKIKNARRLAVIMGTLSIISIILFIYAIIKKVETEKNAAIAVKERNRAEKEKERAEELKLVAENQKIKAEESTQEALNQRAIAEKNREKAKSEQLKAQRNAAEARRQEKIAIQKEAKALRLEKSAEEEKEKAIAQRKIAEREREKAEKLKKLADSAKERADSLRLISVGRALAIRSSRIERQKQKELKGLLAVQGYLFNKQYGGYPFDSEVYDALIQANFALSPIAKRSINTGKNITSFAYSPSVGQLAYSTEGGEITIREIAANGTFGKIITIIKNCKAKNCTVTKIKLLTSEKLLVTGHSNGAIKLWNAANGTLVNATNGSFMGNSPIVGLEITNEKIIGVSTTGRLQTLNLSDLSIEGSTNDLLSEIKEVRMVDQKVILLKKNGELVDFNLETQEASTLALNIKHINRHSDRVIALKKQGEFISVSNGGVRPHYKSSFLIENIKSLETTNQFVALQNEESIALYPINYPGEKPFKIHLEESILLQTLITEDSKFVLLFTANHQLIIVPITASQIAFENCSAIAESLTQEEWEQYIGFDLPYQETCKGL